jgi:hypothetical protein
VTVGNVRMNVVPGAKAPILGWDLLSGLKPGPISGATATAGARATANSNTGVSPLRFAPVEMTERSVAASVEMREWAELGR